MSRTAKTSRHCIQYSVFVGDLQYIIGGPQCRDTTAILPTELLWQRGEQAQIILWGSVDWAVPEWLQIRHKVREEFGHGRRGRELCQFVDRALKSRSKRISKRLRLFWRLLTKRAIYCTNHGCKSWNASANWMCYIWSNPKRWVIALIFWRKRCEKNIFAVANWEWQRE